MMRAVLRNLRELIVALDRRVPQANRASEASIARDAAVLKAGALQRIDEIERLQRRAKKSASDRSFA